MWSAQAARPCCLMCCAVHGVVYVQERIKALVEERKRLLEGGGGSEGGSSGQHATSGKATWTKDCGHHIQA